MNENGTPKSLFDKPVVCKHVRCVYISSPPCARRNWMSLHSRGVAVVGSSGYCRVHETATTAAVTDGDWEYTVPLNRE